MSGDVAIPQIAYDTFLLSYFLVKNRLRRGFAPSAELKCFIYLSFLKNSLSIAEHSSSISPP